MPLRFESSFKSVELPTGWVRSLDFSNDGELLAIGQTGRQGMPAVVVYRTADATPVAELAQDDSAGAGVVLSATGDRLYYALREASGAAAFLTADVASATVDRIAGYGPAEVIHDLVRDASARLVAILSDAYEVWDIAAREVVRFREAQTASRPVQAAFSGDGRQLFTYGTTEGAAVLLDVNTNQEADRWPAPAPFGEQLVINGSGQYLALVGTAPRGVFVYDIRTGERALPAVFNERSFTTRYAFAAGYPLLVTKHVAPVGYDLTSGAMIEGPEMAVGDLTAIAGAWESPIVAFAIGNTVYWIRLVQDEG
jgi:hypothetical protein